MSILSNSNQVVSTMPKLRGKVSRFLANKCAIASKIDAGQPS